MDYTATQELGNKIKELIQDTEQIKIISGENSELIYEGKFKEPQVYCGDFDGTKNNFGGNLPSGETFTELENLENVNGEAIITAYGTENSVKIHKTPALVKIKNGNLTESNDNELIELLELYRKENPEEFQKFFENGFPVRELGFGVNYEIGRQKILPCVVWVEKMPGVHTSIGPSHIHHHDEAIDGLAKKNR